MSNQLFDNTTNLLSKDDRQIMDELASLSDQAYTQFKEYPKLLPYLEKMSTLYCYGKANIGGR